MKVSATLMCLYVDILRPAQLHTVKAQLWYEQKGSQTRGCFTHYWERKQQ